MGRGLLLIVRGPYLFVCLVLLSVLSGSSRIVKVAGVLARCSCKVAGCYSLALGVSCEAMIRARAGFLRFVLFSGFCVLPRARMLCFGYGVIPRVR